MNRIFLVEYDFSTRCCCHWKPVYELRYRAADRRFDLRMIAQITQSSGEIG